MTDRPILFSGPMVRALLDGRKTQTRRVLKPQPGEGASFFVSGRGKHIWDWPGLGVGTDDGRELPKRIYRVGDRLWVRETWLPLDGHSNWDLRVSYAADCQQKHFADGEYDSSWNWPKAAKTGDVPSIHMPRWASRLTLVVTDARVERLQDISEADAKAEGPHQHEDWPEEYHASWRGAFHALWDSLNEKRGFGWDQNPWVAALTFTVHQTNIDAMESANEN